MMLRTYVTGTLATVEHLRWYFNLVSKTHVQPIIERSAIAMSTSNANSRKRIELAVKLIADAEAITIGPVLTNDKARPHCVAAWVCV